MGAQDVMKGHGRRDEHDSREAFHEKIADLARVRMRTVDDRFFDGWRPTAGESCCNL